MKVLSLLLLAAIPRLVSAQTIDTLAVFKEVENLIDSSRYWEGNGDFEKAYQFQETAQQLALEKLGRESDHHIMTLNHRGNIAFHNSDFPQAEQIFLQALALREEVSGRENRFFMRSLGNLAFVYTNMGNYKKAEPMFLEALAYFEKAGKTESDDYSGLLNNLAIVYWATGVYEKAEVLYKKSIAIQERVAGKNNGDYIGSLINLGVLYCQMGNNEAAEPLWLEAKGIFEDSLHMTQHPYYLNCLSNLGELYKLLGNYEAAEPLWIQSVEAYEQTMGRMHPVVAGNLQSLGSLYRTMGQYDKAETKMREALAIYENTLGKEHEDYAGCLSELAAIYKVTRRYKEAETLYLEAVATLEKTVGKEHVHYAVAVSGLAEVYLFTGQYEKAEKAYLQAMTAIKTSLGTQHANYAESLHLTGRLYWAMGRYDKAGPLLTEASSLDQALLIRSLHHLSEEELNKYLRTFSQKHDQALSFALRSGQPDAVSACYDNSLFYKGFLLAAVNQTRHLALSNPATAGQFQQLKAFERQLADNYTLPVQDRDPATMAGLEENINTLEKDLARTVAGFGESLRQVKWNEVQATLQPGEAAVEFVHFQVSFLEPSDSIMYAALLLKPGMQQPELLPLFEEKQLGALVQSQGERRADYVNSLYTIADRGARPTGAPQQTLYELLWQPLESRLAGVQRIHYSPTGLLHRINLSAIPVNIDSVLGDRYKLVGHSSTRQLVLPAQHQAAANDAALFGGIQYEADSAAIVQAAAAMNNDMIASRGTPNEQRPDNINLDANLRGGAWNALPFTEREITSVEKILHNAGIEASAKRGIVASEEAFKALGASQPSPRILHIATHGYFFPDPRIDPAKYAEAADEPIFKVSEHPMIRSGLLLAGANFAWTTGKPLLSNIEDGILTAFEISQMNLSNTELVVLSACETGLGDIEGNEGVYGLQRAFRIAGAKYLIMSLWQVPDKQTSMLMTGFYRNWLEENMEIPEAFHAAQKQLRDLGLDPYYWAGFVLLE